MMEAKIIHISIEKNWHDVYAFARQPENMPLWASGLSSGLKRDGKDWVAHGAIGNIRISFATGNDLGVIDHLVTLESGLQVNNPLCVVPNGDGAEVMFTLLRQPGMSAAQFEADASWVLKDLNTLKTLMET